MSFRCQIYQKRLTFNNVFAKNCDVRLIILYLIATATILPNVECAKLENPQIRLLINDDDLLQEKSNVHEAGGAAVHENSGEHFNLYRSELKRLSYETIHRILRDENEPSYRREDTELRYYQKRSPTYEETHQLIKRATKEHDLILKLSKRNLTEFSLTATIERDIATASIIDLSDNYLSSLNLSLINNLTQLSVLNLKNNSFTVIPLSDQSTIKTLNLNNNLIKTSPLPSNIYLRHLYLSSNHIDQLAAINVSRLKNLESLDISHNRLKTIESSFFPERMHNLKHLNLANNQLECIYRETFYNLLSLNTLLLSHNNITDIDYETFLALPNLQYLDLSFNRLRGKSIRALQGITGLVALNIAFNPEIGAYMQEFVASWSLKELDASGTGLCQIPAALAQSVRSLKLTHNWLKVINCGDLDSYPLLQYLDLSNSHIEHIEDDAMGRLEILEILMLDHNQLHKIPYSLPVSLEHLFLQNNDIMEIPQQAFQGLNNLKTLDLSHNKLMYLPDLSLPKLITLNLQSSEIKGINQGIVHTLPKLTDLMLEDNPIKCSDLLGIAEWASTCRLRAGKEDEEVEVEGGEDISGEEFINIQNLRKKFEKMHNFYEKFDLDQKEENQTLLMFSIKEPSCVKENVKILLFTTTTPLLSPNKDNNVEIQVEGKALNLLTSSLTQKEPLMLQETVKQDEDEPTTTKTNKVENFNQNSMISIPTIKTLVGYNKTDANLNKNAVEQKQQDAVKTIRLENYGKTTEAASATQEPEEVAALKSSSATMQSSIINEKQTFKTTAKTFNNATAATTKIAAATTPFTIIQTTDDKPQQQQHAIQEVEEEEFVVKPRFTNEMKTFDHLTATAVATTTTDADDAATTTSISYTTTTATSAAKDEIASIGNTQTQTFQNMTELVGVAPATTTTNRGEDVVKITSKSLQQGPDDEKKEVNRENLSKEAKDMTTTAALHQQEESTTFATAINSEKQEEATTARATTTMGVEPVAKEITTLKPQINLLKEKQQQHEIKTKIATTKEIKSLTISTITTASEASADIERTPLLKPTTIQTNVGETTINEPTTATPGAATTVLSREIITLKSSTETTSNLDKPNKELKEFKANMEPSSITFKPILRTSTSTITTPFAINKDIMPTISSTTAETTATTTLKRTTTPAILKTSTTEVAATSAVKDKDLTSNYNDNDNNRLTTGTNNNTSSIPNNTPNTIIPPKLTNTTNNNISSTSSSNMKNITSNNNDNINNKMVVTLDITSTTPFTTTTKAATAAETANIVHQNNNHNIVVVDQQQHQQQEQQQHLHLHNLKDEKNVILYHHPSLQKHVNVKCMQSNSNECNSPAIGPQRLEEDEKKTKIGKEPTMETTTTRTTSKLMAAAIAITPSTTTTTALLPVIHKHEPLQLLVKDRHLIGTPLLMHKGQNLMVTADELILPTIGEHEVEKQEDDLKQQPSNKGHEGSNRQTADAADSADIEYAKNSSNKHILDKGQQQQQQQQQMTTDEPKNINISNDNKKGQQDIDNKQERQQQHEQQHQYEQHLEENTSKFKKFPTMELKTKKPSLIMKKMTIITKQHAPAAAAPTDDADDNQNGNEQHQQHQHSLEPKQNEVHPRNFDETHYQELKPIMAKVEQQGLLMHALKHTTVNTPINNQKQANLLKEPHTFQHEHELLIQQILQDQQAETHGKYSKTEQWSELRKAENKENHPGLILLVSSGLFLVLLLGLMHVYRCDMPWRRNSPVHHLRPHQSGSLEDDSHSFLSYHEGIHKWHHSTRLEAPYNSPLHHLHVRELQKTSATEKATTVKSSSNTFKQPICHSSILTNTRSLSQCSTTTTSTASPSSSAILDDESFYIEMTPDSGQLAHALQSELLPMELLNMAAQSSQDYKETIADEIQTSMEDEGIQEQQHPQQHHQQHLTPYNSTTTSALVLPSSSCATTSSSSVKSQSNSSSRKFGLW